MGRKAPPTTPPSEPTQPLPHCKIPSRGSLYISGGSRVESALGSLTGVLEGWFASLTCQSPSIERRGHRNLVCVSGGRRRFHGPRALCSERSPQTPPPLHLGQQPPCALPRPTETTSLCGTVFVKRNYWMGKPSTLGREFREDRMYQGERRAAYFSARLSSAVCVLVLRRWHQECLKTPLLVASPGHSD